MSLAKERTSGPGEEYRCSAMPRHHPRQTLFPCDDEGAETLSMVSSGRHNLTISDLDGAVCPHDSHLADCDTGLCILWQLEIEPIC